MDKNYVNVPTYIEKAVKKLLKHIPEDEVDPNQMKMNFETGKIE